MTQLNSPRIAFIVTPHGFGHAARAAAVMNSLHGRAPGVGIEIFTKVPAWFFEMSLTGAFGYHELRTDIGLVQLNSMEANLEETIHQLEAFLPFREEIVQPLAQEIRSLDCQVVVCDIAPLGIAAAKAAGIPSILVENFTWDWIYAAYLEEEPRFGPFIAFLEDTFHSADYHVRSEPGCAEFPVPDLLANVASRKPRQPRWQTREQLGVSQEAKLVLITMGGILTDIPFIHRLEDSRDVLYLVPGGGPSYEKRGGLVLIPYHSNLYHPDLVEACDAVIGKLGYSTLAEAYTSGIPFAFVPRAKFRESQPVGRFAREVMGAVEISEEGYFSGYWLDQVPAWLALPRRKPAGPNGADQIADFILEKIKDAASSSGVL